jgi:NADH:ubiquinone oxidoreductase subunit H
MGGVRATAQIVSYELILSTAILCVIFITGSLNYTKITEIQQVVWLALPLLPILVTFFISSLAELNRTPFDLVEAIWLLYNISIIEMFYYQLSSLYIGFILALYIGIEMFYYQLSSLYIGIRDFTRWLNITLSKGKSTFCEFIITSFKFI